MFLRRKSRTGAAARAFQAGVEALDTRAVPAGFFPLPGAPLLESGLNATLRVSLDEQGHAIASFTSINPFTGRPTTQAAPLQSNLNAAGAPVAVPGVPGTGTTLAYHLPTPVAPGDVGIYDFQTGRLSDVLRFTDGIDPTSGLMTGWVLVYSDMDSGTPDSLGTDPSETTPDPADVGIPANFNPFSFLTQAAFEFGVEGWNFADYQTEQAVYSFQSDGNLVSGAPLPGPTP